MTRRTPMKRTAFARKAPARVERSERVLAPIIPPAKFRAPAPVATAAPVPKNKPYRSERYQRLVAALPCVICAVEKHSQAAHGSEGKGTAIKACDTTLFPACADRPGVRGCHSKLDQGALYTKEQRRFLEPIWAAKTRATIRAAGAIPKNFPTGTPE